MEHIDRSLACRDCGTDFVWTAGEQNFFQEKGLTNIPVRCPACRSARKVKQGLPERAMAEVTCAECGSATTVPFIPRNGRPVYCAHCFDEVKSRALVAEAAPQAVPSSQPQRVEQVLPAAAV